MGTIAVRRPIRPREFSGFRVPSPHAAGFFVDFIG
jgi:hypothetical protein